MVLFSLRGRESLPPPSRLRFSLLEGEEGADLTRGSPPLLFARAPDREEGGGIKIAAAAAASFIAPTGSLSLLPKRCGPSSGVLRSRLPVLLGSLSHLLSSRSSSVAHSCEEGSRPSGS